MRSISKAISRRSSSLKNTRNFTGTPPSRPIAPVAKTSTTPIAHALESSPKYLSPSPPNKALTNPPHSSQPIPTTPNTLEADYPLLNMDLLGIKRKDRKWFTAVNIAVRTHMNNLDASHNYQHIRRVVSNAAYILAAEKKHHQWARDLDPTAVYTTCMTHDIGDTKYQGKGEQRSQSDTIVRFLGALGCPLNIRRQAACLGPRVSFTKEMADEAGVEAFAEKYPALRIVQDADRLDGLGAIGVSRLFVYGGVDERRRNGPIGSGIELIDKRCGEYVRLMKTQTGRDVAVGRYEWMKKEFVRLWEGEADTSNV